MKHWAVFFWNAQTGKKDYREYPQMANLAKREGLCEMLNNHEWYLSKRKDGWIVDKIEEYDPIKAKLELANELGKLIYN